ncbi:MAG: NgoFVII family restriction endonuclease [Bacteroidales bacterium]|nr:NgoFVII family restriction endonuclease [Bacteroidales bacterium]
MQKYNKNYFLSNWQNNKKYFDMLSLMGSLSKLFSENNIPYLDYRLAENLFCKYFDAINNARDCTSYDARLENLGIGIKTFILKSDSSNEKVAEFNKLKPELNKYRGIELAKKISEFRNKRIQFANDLYNIAYSQYHIVGRQEGILRVFNTEYDTIDENHIHVKKDTDTSISFNDEVNEYIFNKSKSVLMKRFILPKTYKDIKVEILENPLDLLERFFGELKPNDKKLTKGIDYVILPLYSLKLNEVAPKSGLNQWNANGRPRHEDELYIPVPSYIHKHYPNFFPERDRNFELILPDGKVLSAKMCQDGSKSLMSNPNSELGNWLLRKVLHKPPRTLVTMQDLNEFGFDSICVQKMNYKNNNGQFVYKIYFAQYLENYNDFSDTSNNEF